MAAWTPTPKALRMLRAERDDEKSYLFQTITVGNFVTTAAPFHHTGWDQAHSPTLERVCSGISPSTRDHSAASTEWSPSHPRRREGPHARFPCLSSATVKGQHLVASKGLRISQECIDVLLAISR